MKSNISMEDIAKKLGVSKGLVSIALAGKYGVSDETRLKIIVTASDMKYDIKTGKSKYNYPKKKKILVFLNRGFIDDVNYWGKIVKGIEQQATSLNSMILISTWEKNNDLNEFLLNVIDTRADGVIFLGTTDSRYPSKIDGLSIPIVLIDSNYIGVNYNHIIVNNYCAAYEICNYLTNLGFTHLCFIGSRKYSLSFRQRYRGIQEFLIDNQLDNIKCDFILNEPEKGDPETYSRKQTNEYLKNNRPQVIICANDYTASLIYEDLNILGLSIPDDVSVVGFDNIDMCERMDPLLTSISTDKEYIGEQAVVLLMQSINNINVPKKTIQLATKLIERNSVKKPL